MMHIHLSPARLVQVQGYNGGENFHFAPKIVSFLSPTSLLLNFIQYYLAGMWASEVIPTHLRTYVRHALSQVARLILNLNLKCFRAAVECRFPGARRVN
jgi:hypothetical protein